MGAKLCISHFHLLLVARLYSRNLEWITASLRLPRYLHYLANIRGWRSLRMKHHNWWGRSLSTRVRATNRIHNPSQGCIFKGRWDCVSASLPPWGARRCPSASFAMCLWHGLLSTHCAPTSGACHAQEHQARQGWPHSVAVLLRLGSKGLIPNELGFPVKPKPWSMTISQPALQSCTNQFLPPSCDNVSFPFWDFQIFPLIIRSVQAASTLLSSSFPPALW